MAGRADIEAGRAYVELFVKHNKLVQGLNTGTRYVQNFVSGVAAIATTATAATAAIVAPIALATRQFINAGSGLNDLSARTGVAATQLAHLKFAAEQTGASIGDVEIALRTMARKGLGTDIDAVAQRINAIPDPAKRAAAAMDAMGKSGTRLLPMLAEWKSLKAASDALGPVLTEDEVRLADELGDKFGALSEAMSRAMMQIGVQLGPHLKNILDGAIGMVVKFSGALKDTNEFGRGGDWLDKAAEFLRTPLAEFVAAGSAAPGLPRATPQAAAGAADQGSPASKEQFDSAVDIQREINRGWERRQALIRETQTDLERYWAKEREFAQAFTAVQRNRIGGFLTDEQADAQKRGLQIALQRVRAAEAERRAAEAERLAPKRPEVAKETAPELPKKEELLRSVTVGFSATGLVASGGGVRDATVSELKLLRKEFVEANKKLAKLAGAQPVARAG